MHVPAVGSRVVVRYRLPVTDGPPLTDAIGKLVSASAESLTVDLDGAAVTVALTDVVAVKALGARRVRNSEIRALEHAAALAWPGTDHEWLDGWLLRAGGGVTSRANSAVPLLPEASAATLDHIVRWYTGRGIAPRLCLPDRLFPPPPGWTVGPDALVLTAPLLATRTGVARHGDVRDARTRAADASDSTFLRIGDDAVARTAVTTAPDGRRWVGITAVHVSPERRREGLASALCADALQWGHERGATDAYVQVEESNAPARRLYEQLGFTEHHRYRYCHR